ncbi:hypothetical protein GCM10007382_15650 [Salinibacterium xinjiangense]|uniref:DUF916 domain-containing protein n=1 Tax=Salinibacterium xinjiangense TaxID=386302 RepID=A0A2C8YAW5_9MICO|nr:DUF916 domain-containing protein [Salinibacterium xinjiangense]GGK96254.1 hypothetical protein GCM10007382_15650 [Salinibacterium xinjiangense]SOE47386.1 protein of unknown function [Salinibacterium xinjiangense]
MSRITTPISLLMAMALALSPLAVSAFGFAPAPTAAAVDGDITWSVEPAPTAEGGRRTFDYKTDPGTQINDTVLVTNQGTTAAEFLIYATDARNELETGAFGLLKREEEPIDAGAWITTDIDKITLQPGTEASIPFTVLVPSDATPGDHVGGIVASVLTTGDQDGAAVVLEQRVGARVYLTVSGIPDVGVETSGFLAGFTPELNPFAPGTMSVTYDVRNTGNVRMDVNQKLQITGPFSIPLGELTPEPISNILPRQTVRVTSQVPAIAALLMAWSTVTLVPGAIGTAGNAIGDSPTAGASSAPTSPAAADPAVAAPAAADPAAPVVETEEALEFLPVSSSAFSLAMSWTLLALIVVVILAIFLVHRYVTGMRDRLYDAIDEAAEAARIEALGGPGTTGVQAV